MVRKALIGAALAASVGAAIFVLNHRGDLHPQQLDWIRVGGFSLVLFSLFLEGEGRIWLGMVVGFVLEAVVVASVLAVQAPGEPLKEQVAANWLAVLGPPLYGAGVLGGFEAVLKGKVIAGVVGLVALLLLRMSTGLVFPVL